jgi:two-component system LytT family response regulator
MINCIIIDDEERARNGLQKMIEKYCTGVKIIGQADTVRSGVKIIQEMKPDLIFLDIDMPDGDGFELLEQLNRTDFDIIFATAYDQFALKAFKVAALDYLVKPIDLEDLIDAIDKVKLRSAGAQKQEQYNQLKSSIASQKFNKIALPGTEGLTFVELEDIIRLEADGNYTVFHMKGGDKHMVSKLLGDYEGILDSSDFFRVHHSHLINLNHISKYVKGRGGYIVMNDGSSVDVSVRKKEEFLEILKGL